MTSANVARRCDCWIESYLSYSAGLQSPARLRRWAAISLIGATLERKVWIRTLGREVFPNLYTLLIAPPGVGKSLPLGEIETLFQGLEGPYMAPSSVSASALIDALAEAKRKILRPAATPPYLEFHSIYAVSSELSVLFPEYSVEMMSYLTDLYDCRETPFRQRRRTKDLNIKIPHPQVNLLGATTPSQLGRFLPEGAWDQGFMSRVIMIFAADMIRPKLFFEPPDNTKANENLLFDLRRISELIGKMEWEEEAMVAMEYWHQAGGPPIPDHPKLVHYTTRRTIHLLKLSMISAVSRRSDMLIKLEDLQRAQDWLIEAEAQMPDIFKSMAIGGGDSDAIEETWQYVYRMFAKEKKPLSEYRVVGFLKERVPSYSVLKIIEIMVRSNYLKIVPLEGGTMGYQPMEKTKRY